MPTVIAQPQGPRAKFIVAIVVSLILNGLLGALYFKQGREDRRLLAQRVADQRAQIAQRDRDNEDLKKQIGAVEVAVQRLKTNRATKDASIIVPDGVIATVAGNDCFINLGRGDQISVGMTFEVYDHSKGIAPLDNLPAGKGSIELVSVGPDHTSQCRIIHVEPGQIISQGDLIGNLVYDRNIKFNFFVHGDFDLANGRNGRRTNDIAVIRRLIQQWGGQVQAIADSAKPADSVTSDTSFVVIGRELHVPVYTEAEKKDARIQSEIDRATARLAAYKAVLEKASEYGVPVLNQESFLYRTGYFDQARR